MAYRSVDESGRGGPHRRRRPNLSKLGFFSSPLVPLFAISLLIASCGGTSEQNGNADPPKSASTTTNPQEAAVLRAYRAASAAFNQASATANAYDPDLPATMANPQLQQVRANLLGDKDHGVIGKGTVELHPKVESITSTMATVVDCVYSRSFLVYANSGKQVPPVTGPEHDGVNATLILVGSTWKESKQIVTEGKCAGG